MANKPREHPDAQPEYQNPTGCLTRIFWMMMGPCALLLTAVAVARSTGWSIADVALWLIVCLTIGARYIDVVRYSGATMEGEPATMADFKLYAVMVLLLGVALWVAARALGPGLG